jgi:hypothetical protein
MLAQILPLLNKTQREALKDLDLWQRDELKAKDFEIWIKAYAHCPKDSIRQEFSHSEQFLLYLKHRLSIQTFDVEDPLYPDHDYYFLTDDNLLLFEYDEDFEYVDEVKDLIRTIYFAQGVDNAYAYLFKMVSDSYHVHEEEQYHLKKSRLEDLGFVDYFESLEFFAPFHSLEKLYSFIKRNLQKKVPGQEINSLAKTQIQSISSELSILTNMLNEIIVPMVASIKRNEFP